MFKSKNAQYFSQIFADIFTLKAPSKPPRKFYASASQYPCGFQSIKMMLGEKICILV